MNSFSYKRGSLYCENLKLERLCDLYQTPLYVYSQKTLLANFEKIKKAFSSYKKTLICYSLKANSNLAVIKLLVRKGAGLDIVSGGELYRAKLAKCQGKKIVYASVGKTKAEISAAVDYGILLFNIESLAEAELINEVGREKDKRIDVALRINPDVEAHTHAYTTTGKKENKFGLALEVAEETILNKSADYPYLNFCALHLHIGSQIMQVLPFIKALDKTMKLVRKINKKSRRLKYLNLGGGLGIDYKGKKEFPLKEFARRIIKTVSPYGLSLILEPGRYIVGPAGVLLTKVLYLKNTQAKRFVIVDAAMNDLLRPSLYNASHRILNLKQKSAKLLRKKVDVVGPVCESGDFLAKDIYLAAACGDCLAVMDVGAYGFSMASNYNSRTKPAEVLVCGKRARLIRKRDSLKDLVRKEL